MPISSTRLKVYDLDPVLRDVHMSFNYWFVLAMVGAVIGIIAGGFLIYFGVFTPDQASLFFIIATIGLPVTERFFPLFRGKN